MSSSDPDLRSQSQSFLLIGHRGLPRLTPENSAAGFKLAAELHIPMVELDVRMTRDRELVVIHDDNIKKLSDGKGKVNQKDFRYLRQFDYGSSFHERFRGEKLLRLEEALEILLPKVSVMIELKEDKHRRAEIAQVLTRILEKRGLLLSGLIVCSFSYQMLLEVQKRNPEIWLGLIFRTKPKRNFMRAYELGFDSVHPHHRVAKKKLVQWAKAQGLKVFVWTLNSFKSVKKWRSLDIDGIITDIPERFINRL